MTMFKPNRLPALIALVASCVPLYAQREPVLKQIDLPHPYYFREMYLPQLTTGASAVSWSADGKFLVYSMAGSLWRQEPGSSEATQLTTGAGYDYQPDCSHDGRWVIYSSYLKDAVELWTLDLQTMETHALTSGGFVNLEPRFSPDGKRVAFVSTSYNSHFHIFTAQFDDGRLASMERLTGENRSNLPRYYYSQVDHEISPVWSSDGTEIVFVSNRNSIYGTGGFWRTKAEPGAESREIHYEETTWKARPDISPDGKRLIYGSYLGQQWHQLWLMPSDGGDAFPVSYGDFDNINPRWSPDGLRVAFISNREGNTSLWVMEIPGGKQIQIVANKRHYLQSVGELTIRILDESGRPSPARIFVTAEDHRAYAPDDAWMRADDNFTRAERPFEAHYFHTSGIAHLTLPAGTATVEAMKGFEYKFEQRNIKISAGQSAKVTIRLQPLNVPHEAQEHLASGDVHIHMNYGGAYRNHAAHLVKQAVAENLAIAEDLIVNKEQRIPDIKYFATQPDAASTPTTLLLHGQEYHTSYWGHLGLLNLNDHIILPGYAGYPTTAAASLYPANANIEDLAHQQGATVGYVHPYESVPDPANDTALNHALPVDLALGKVDYIEILGFSDPKSTAEVWYRLLNCGFHLPTAGGTDAIANFASLRGPVGLNRVYVNMPPGALKIAPWLKNLKEGRTFATNGPLLGLKISGKEPGDTIRLSAHEDKGENQRNVKFTAWMRSIVPVDHLELICNGKLARTLKIDANGKSADVQDSIPVLQSGWCLLRAFSDKAEHPILDAYPYATTSPIYVELAGSVPTRDEEATYFENWIDGMLDRAKANQDWNSEMEKSDVLEQLGRARKVYEHLRQR